MRQVTSEAAIEPQYDGPDRPARTLALEVFERLRADILSSQLPPGKKLRFEELRKAYGVGLSPLREALSRLAENRLVVATGQRGFRVPSVSVQDFMDIAMVRKEIEDFALRHSIKNGDDAWEARLVAAHYKMNLVAKSGKEVSEEVWERRHREFHYTLVSCCNSPCLLHLHGLLNDLFDRYRRLSLPADLWKAPRTLMHQRIVDAALARNADLAAGLLADHIDDATKLIVDNFQSVDRRRKPAKASAKRPRRARAS